MSLLSTLLTYLLLLGAFAAQAKGLQRDLKSLFTDGHFNLPTLGLELATTAHTWNNDFQRHIETAFAAKPPTNIVTTHGSANFDLPLSLGLWSLGRIKEQAAVEKLGSGLLRTLAFTQLTMAPIKLAVLHERSDGRYRRSFPSGSTARNVAMARFMHRSYGKEFGIPLYVFSGLVAAGHLEHNRHFLLDVAMGTALGILVGNSTMLEKTNKIEVAPTSNSLLLRVKF